MSKVQVRFFPNLLIVVTILAFGGLPSSPQTLFAQESAEVQVLEILREQHGVERVVLSRVELAQITRESSDFGSTLSAPDGGPHEEAWLSELLSQGLIDGLCNPVGGGECAGPGSLSVRMSRLQSDGAKGVIYAAVQGKDSFGQSWYRFISFTFAPVDDAWELESKAVLGKIS